MNKQAFTLIEIIVALTILSLVMVSVFEIYSNIIALNKRLEVSRNLQENARNITETIAKDVRENGIAFGCYSLSATSAFGGSLTAGTEYSGSGTDILTVKVAPENCPSSSECFVSYYLMHDNAATAPTKCAPTDQACYLGRQLPDGQRIRVTDSGVQLDGLRFFISGVDAKTFSKNTDSEGKVTMSFRLSPAPRQGITPEIARALAIPIQTTITEKLYKSR